MKETEHLSVVHEDDQIVVINKPFSLLSQSDRNEEPGAYELLKKQLGNPPLLAMMQRLDRVAGGLMLFAKTSTAADHLKKQFESREVGKTYWAVCERKPDQDEATLKHFLKKWQNPVRIRAFDEKVKGSKEAVLHYKVLKTRENRAMLQIELETGRTHQIRVQLAKIACPIVGDKKYGKTKFLKDQSIALFSQSIVFKHPATGQEQRVELADANHPVFAEMNA